MTRYELYQGDNREVLKTFADNSMDSIVCDPPYELAFMGKRWDSTGIAYDATLWAECLRVLKPGGHLIAFGGTRTYHRMTVAIEDAGFEIRDCIQWIYGCLDEQTQIVTPHGLRQYNKLKIGDTVLCYNIDSKSYQYEQVQDVVVYDYHDTAYRIIGDFGEQVVSRNHRVIVERDGSEVFVPAEALQSEERVPILEGVRSMRKTVPNTQSHTAITQQNVLKKMHQSTIKGTTNRKNKSNICQGCGELLSMWNAIDDVSITNQKSKSNHLQSSVQWETASERIDSSFTQGYSFMDRGNKTSTETANDWQSKPIVERWLNISQSQGIVCESVNQICEMSDRVCDHGTQGWICDGTSDCGSNSHQSPVDTNGSSTSHQSRCNQQLHQQFDVICEQCRTQIIRAQQGHKTTVVRIVPFTYTGKVWCVRVPSGAFVAERNGVYFPTGNSGFPKSLDVSKAIDKQAGAEREVVGIQDPRSRYDNSNRTSSKQSDHQFDKSRHNSATTITAPATPKAQQWHGWGTAAKPAHEPAVLARKPLSGTVADNVLTWGVGAINVDGCRVGGKDGRWPANVIFDEDAAEALDAQSDAGASRFFYTAKASKSEREAGLDGVELKVKHTQMRSANGTGEKNFEGGFSDSIRANHHPTVKPIALMRYLVRLVTPKGGVVLDPFMGSGSTGCAAMLEGMRFVGIDLTPEYVEIAERRIQHWMNQNPMGL